MFKGPRIRAAHRVPARVLTVALAWAAIACPLDAWAAGAPRRRAIVVGANGAPPGRRALRFAHRDASQIAAVLVEVGGFSRDDVRLLLDPDPAALLEAIDSSISAAAAEESVLLFYYSGHADDRALYPAGKALPLEALKARLADPRAKLRIGIIDSCRGGSWTETKGLRAQGPFHVDLAEQLASSGSVLIASSSGSGDAHEAEAVGGSFFTHHLAAGLRGAADANGDGRISLNEAYGYAQRLTVRDSALYAGEPQAPSFRLDLHGRQDLVLAQIDHGPSRVDLSVSRGPLELIQLASGTQVLEIPGGSRRLQLALPAGEYVLRRREGTVSYALEFALKQGEVIELAEADLRLVGAQALAEKQVLELPRAARPIVPPGYGDMRLALGVAHGPPLQGIWSVSPESNSVAALGTLTFGLISDLELTLPGALTGRVALDPGLELFPWGGVTSMRLGYSQASALSFGVDLATGLAVRYELGRAGYLIGGLELASRGEWSATRNRPLKTWTGRLSAGYSITLGGLVSLSLGLTAGSSVLDRGALVAPGRGSNDVVISLGSVLDIGPRRQPLIQLHLTDIFSIDGYAIIDFAGSRVEDTYLLGVGFNF